MEKLAIIGIFYDGYYDIWEDFLELKDKFWKDCPYPTYIVNNIKELEFSKEYNVEVLHAGVDAEFSRKVQLACERIQAEKYLILLEDFFFGTPLTGPILDEKTSFMDKYGVKYYCMPVNGFLHIAKGKLFKGYDHIHNFETTDEYTISCQAAIWDRKFLMDCVGSGNYNAWVFEGIYCKSKYAHTVEFLNKCKIDDSNYLGLQHGALQGKMIPTVISYFSALDYKMRNTRPILDQHAYQKHLNKIRIKSMVPLCIQKIIKKLFKTNSVIERYRKEIEEQMFIMNLN